MGLLKISLLGACAWSLVVAAPALAGSDDPAIERGPVPGWALRSEPLAVPTDADGLLFVRQLDSQVHLEADGQRSYVGQRVKLLNAQALQIGNLAIGWNPQSGTPVLHALKVYRGAKTIDLTDTAKFEVLRREDQLEQAMLSGTLTAVYKVPDLRVGDELEMAFTIPSSDPTLKDTSSGVMMLPGTTMPGRYRLTVSWDAGQEPRLAPTDDFGSPPVRTADAWSVLVDNPPLIDPPKDAPPRFGWQRVLEFTDFPSWNALSKRFGPMYAAAAALPATSPLKEEAAQIAAEHPDPLGRAQAALELVQDQVRYVYVGLDGGNFRPASADDTWQRRYGDCKAKTALLLALLGELGVPAQAVLVNANGADDGLAARLPSPGLFDHVIVRAQIDGKAYWLDGTLPGVIQMSERPAMPYRAVLPLTAEGSDLVKLDRPAASLPDEMGIYDIDARGGFDKPARMTQTLVKRGPEAILQYLQLSALTSDQMTQAFRKSAIGDGQWQAIDTVKYRFDRATQASILTISGLNKLDWEDQDGGGYQLALPGGGFSAPSERKREANEDQSAPFYSAPSFSCYATTVRLPDDTPLKNWAFNSVFDTMMFGQLYYRMMERRDDRTIRLVRGSRVERPEIDAATAKRDNARLDKFDNSKAVITYDPHEVAKPWGKLEPVPAPDELDWTGADAPCLPKDVVASAG